MARSRLEADVLTTNKTGSSQEAMICALFRVDVLDRTYGSLLGFIAQAPGVPLRFTLRLSPSSLRTLSTSLKLK